MGKAAAILASNPLPADSLAAHKHLVARVSPEVARAAMALRDLRARARTKFRTPENVLLTAKGLEQATDGRVAAWRAAEFVRLCPDRTVWDCTTGLGADAIGLQERGFRVLASDLDLLTAQIAGFNLGAVAGSRTPARAFAADATHPPLATGLGELLLLFDPDRRALESSNTRGRPGGGRRRLDPASFSPPLTEWGALLASVAGAAIKLPPGLDPASLEESGPLAAFLERTPHRWTWTESGGELRELTLWTGQLAPPGEAPRTAVRVFGPGLPPSGEDPVAAQLSGQPEGQHFGELPDPETLTWIAEARPSARRSGLAGTACRAALPSATPIDEGLSYWATSQAEAPSAPTDFADVFQVLASAPLDKKHARRMLREHDVGPLTVKKRGLDESSATLASRIALKTGRPGLVIATPTRSGRRLFLVERLARNAEESPT